MTEEAADALLCFTLSANTKSTTPTPGPLACWPQGLEDIPLVALPPFLYNAVGIDSNVVRFTCLPDPTRAMTLCIGHERSLQ